MSRVYKWHDIVKGDINLKGNIGGWVIQKKDGYPTYNFAVVVDDLTFTKSHTLAVEMTMCQYTKTTHIYGSWLGSTWVWAHDPYHQFWNW